VYYQQNLRVQLQDRRNRLYKAVSETYQNEVKYLLDFIKKTPYLNGVVQDLIAQEPQIDWPQWKAEHFQSDRTFELPDDETASAKVSYAMICECAETKEALGTMASMQATGGATTLTVTCVHLRKFLPSPFSTTCMTG
jgi:hypothetical protein